jgi:hypothetical protein
MSLKKHLEIVDQFIAYLDHEMPSSTGSRQVNVLQNGLGLRTDAGREALRVALANVILIDEKQRDYGAENISDFGAFGCVVRMNDKIKRLKNLYNNRRRKAVNESIIDSFRDESNYGIIATLCELGLWPSK